MRDDLFAWPPPGARFFGGGGAYPPPPPSIPSEESPEMRLASETARKKEAELMRKRKGRFANLLTGGSGVTDQLTLAKATLIGGRERLGQ